MDSNEPMVTTKISYFMDLYQRPSGHFRPRLGSTYRAQRREAAKAEYRLLCVPGQIDPQAHLHPDPDGQAAAEGDVLVGHEAKFLLAVDEGIVDADAGRLASWEEVKAEVMSWSLQEASKKRSELTAEQREVRNARNRERRAAKKAAQG